MMTRAMILLRLYSSWMTMRGQKHALPNKIAYALWHHQLQHQNLLITETQYAHYSPLLKLKLLTLLRIVTYRTQNSHFLNFHRGFSSLDKNMKR